MAKLEYKGCDFDPRLFTQMGIRVSGLFDEELYRCQAARSPACSSLLLGVEKPFLSIRVIICVAEGDDINGAWFVLPCGPPCGPKEITLQVT